MSEKYVYADLPRTGLCNMFFPWARAELYARDHAVKMIAPKWVKVNRIGPWLRGERDKRYYFRQFTNDGYVAGMEKWWALHIARNSVAVISGMGRYFRDIEGEHEFLLEALTKITSPNILSAIEKLPDEFIGVHIRRGDFATIGMAQPMDYYLRGIQRAQQIGGENLPVLIFSDGREDEMLPITSRMDVKLMPPGPALQDMLSLARAKVLVGTNNSTFSGWAAFLGRMPNIWKGGEDFAVTGCEESFYV